MLTIEDVAKRNGWGDRTARTYVAAWFNAWDLHWKRLARSEASTAPSVPETTKLRTGGRGRPPYGIVEASYDAWVRSNTAPANDIARARAAA